MNKTRLQRILEEDIFEKALKTFDLYYVGYDEKAEKMVFVNRVAKEKHALIISCKENTLIFYERYYGTWKEMIEGNVLIFTEFMTWARSNLFDDFVKPFNMSFQLF